MDLEQASIAHALRELNDLDVFTYVPPFRGRAIRMIHRDVPFEVEWVDDAIEWEPTFTGVSEGGGEQMIPPPAETVHVYGGVFGTIALAAIASAVSCAV